MTLVDAVVAAGWAAAPPGRSRLQGQLLDSRLPSSNVVQGVDVGGTKIHAAAWVPGEARIAEAATGTDPRGGAVVMGQIAELVRNLAGGRPVGGLAVGLPGTPVPATGRLELAPNLPGWDRLDVPRELGRRAGLVVEVQNDVNMAAWGEHVWSGERDLAFVAVGTGVGVGIVQDGRLIRGAGGAAGEVYDLPLLTASAQEEATTLEDVACGPGLEREYWSRAGRRLSSPEILRHAPSDPDAMAALAAVTTALAHLVAAIHTLVDPAVVVMGGGLGSRDVVVDVVAAHLAKLGRRRVQVRGSLLGARASTVGALARALRSTETTQR